MTEAVQTDATASVYLIALSVGLENHCPSHLPDRWIYEEPRACRRRFMQLERPHDKQIRLRYFLVGVPIPRQMRSCSEIQFRWRSYLLDSRNLIDNFSDLLCPFPFLLLHIMTNFTSFKGIEGHPYFNTRLSSWYNKQGNEASVHSRTSWRSTRRVNQSVLCHWPLNNICV